MDNFQLVLALKRLLDFYFIDDYRPIKFQGLVILQTSYADFDVPIHQYFYIRVKPVSEFTSDFYPAK